MLHDAIQKNIWGLIGPMDQFARLPDTDLEVEIQNWRDSPFNDPKVILENITRLAVPIFRDKPVPFYFELQNDPDSDDSKLDPALVDTAKDFFHEGILRLPHDKIMLIVNFSDKRLPLVLAEGKTLEDQDCLLVIPLLHSKNNAEDAILSYGIRAIRGERDTLTTIDFIKDGEVDRANCYKLIDAALYFILLMNMPHYNKEKVEISEKLNKKRVATGKAPYRGYTKIFLKPEIRRALASMEGGGGWTVRPHWRRGHIRTLATGKKIPVRPTMVNWDGDSKLDKNIYVVEGELK